MASQKTGGPVSEKRKSGHPPPHLPTLNGRMAATPWITGSALPPLPVTHTARSPWLPPCPSAGASAVFWGGEWVWHLINFAHHFSLLWTRHPPPQELPCSSGKTLWPRNCQGPLNWPACQLGSWPTSDGQNALVFLVINPSKMIYGWFESSPLASSAEYHGLPTPQPPTLRRFSRASISELPCRGSPVSSWVPMTF